MQKHDVTIIDIRDYNSYLGGHISDSIHVTGDKAEAFMATADRNKPLIIYCYHGNSSQDAARYFSEKGFSTVYSMDGGFEAWRVKDLSGAA